uniref:Cell division protein ZapB n=1 Tax=candidate division WOR-3 bacterium TaxID=2052148 RepID=A0A7C6EEB8_UNCW3
MAKGIAEAEFLILAQKIEKALALIEKLKQENQQLRAEIERLNNEKKMVIERINFMLDKIDEIL